MSRWEDKYNKINPNIDKMIEEQNSKMNESRRKQAELGKDVNSEEYKQAKADLKIAKTEKDKLEQLKPNLKKVSNIIEFRKQVEKRLNEYYNVKDMQDKISSNNNKIKRREENYKKASDTIKDLTAKLQSGSLTPSEKTKINMQITKATNEKQEAFKENIELKKENESLSEELKQHKYGELNKKEINQQIQNLGATIVKCDMACSNLMNGKNVEDIQFDKSKHKYTRPKQEKTNDTKPQENELNIGTDDNEKDTAPHTNEEGEKSNLFDDNYVFINDKPTFSEKHPRLAKIGNFFKNIKDKIFNRGEKLELGEGQEIELPEDAKKPKDVKPEIELTDKEMDRMAKEILADNKNLDNLGSKGVKVFRDDIRVTISEEAKAKLEKWRKDNGYRQGDTGPTMTPKGRAGLDKIDRTVEEINGGGREPGE